MSKINKWLLWALIAAALIGFVDASYLTITHFQGNTPSCSLVEGCDVVTSSEYAMIAGVPVALLGALYYLGALALLLFYTDKRHARALTWLALYSWAGLIAAIYFVSLQLFVINAICLYCMGSAASSTLLWALAQYARSTTKEPRTI